MVVPGHLNNSCICSAINYICIRMQGHEGITCLAEDGLTEQPQSERKKHEVLFLLAKTQNFEGAKSEQSNMVLSRELVKEDIEQALEEKPDDRSDEARVRKHFPETWLWNIMQTDANGLLSFTESVPDTITNWKLKAFAFNADHGLGVANPVELTVFQDFFLTMNLPYAVVKGEQFDLQLLVFNYKTNPVRVQVDLEENVGFDVITMGTSKHKLISQILMVAPKSSSMAKIPISPNTVGDLLLRAKATDKSNSSNTDTVERILPVKPEGREVSDSEELPPVKMSDGGQTHILQFNKFLSVDTADIVEESFRMYLYVTGDMMGPFLNNLEGSVRMPTGCGEQNIKLLAPSIFVAMYLESVDRFDSETKSKCVKYSGIGYSRQLRFKHTEGESAGGYSAWGQRSPSHRSHASTWLTAFVLKTFSLLAQADLTYVSRTTLQQAFQYLKKMAEEKTEDAFFQEKGRVIHTEMQGGTSAGIGMSAFCLIAIMDLRDLAAQDQNTTLVTAIDDLLSEGMEWLRSKKSYLMEKRKPYPLVITAYALAKASTTIDDEIYQTAVDMLEEFENLKNKTEPTPLECPYINFWRRPACNGNETVCQSNNNCTKESHLCCYNGCIRTCMPGQKPRRITGPTEIETYGYALMGYTMLARQARNTTAVFNELRYKAEEVSKWLISKRKAGGNFETTQDTVVGLEALARYAIVIEETKQADFRVRAKAGNQYISDWLTFTSEDYMTTKSAKLNMPSTPPFKDLQIIFEGTKGIAYTTIEALYNTRTDRSTSPFEVVISTYTGVTNERVVQTCVRNKKDNLSISPMVTVTLQLGSGYKYTGGTEEIGVAFRSTKVETDDNKSTVSYYYMNDQEDNFSTQRCYNCTIKEEVEIKNRKPGNVRVLDYYNPNNTAEFSLKDTYSVAKPVSTGHKVHFNQAAVITSVVCLFFL